MWTWASVTFVTCQLTVLEVLEVQVALEVLVLVVPEVLTVPC